MAIKRQKSFGYNLLACERSFSSFTYCTLNDNDIFSFNFSLSSSHYFAKRNSLELTTFLAIFVPPDRPTPRPPSQESTFIQPINSSVLL